MTELPCAEVIPFPDRPASPRRTGTAGPSTVGPVSAEVRLTRALNGLNEAVNAQRVAMAAWRAALGDLQTVTGRLGESLRTYHDNLGHLSTRVKSLGSEAVRLEAWADGVLARDG
jgi:hypothetical protein